MRRFGAHDAQAVDIACLHELNVGTFEALAAALCWAVSNVWVRPVGRHYSPLVLNVHRTLPAGIALVIIALLLGKGPDIAHIPTWRLVGLLGSSLLGLGVGDSLYYQSLTYIGVSRAFPIAQTAQPLFALAISAVFLGERFGVRELVGAGLALGGIYLVTRSAGARTQAPSAASNVKRGLFLAFTTAVVWAAAISLAKVLIGDLDPMGPFAIRMLFTGLCLAMVARVWRYPMLPKGLAWSTAVLGGAGGGTLAAVGGLSMFFAFQTLGLGRTSILTSISPLFLLPMAVVIGRERLTPSLAAGAVVSIAGIALIAA